MVNIYQALEGIKETIKVYMDKPYTRILESTIINVVKEKGKRAYLIVDKSIFHPRSGGQPSDVGVIVNKNNLFKVIKVLNVKGVLAHYGKIIQGEFNPEDVVKLEIDWNYRFKIMKLHTAGHIIDYALKEVYGKVVNTLDAFHGPPQAYIVYDTWLPNREMLNRIEEISNKIVEEDRKVKIAYTIGESLLKTVFNAPNIERLPPSEKYRIVIIEGINGIPCTGTHVRKTSEIGKIKILGVEKLERGFKLLYDVQ